MLNIPIEEYEKDMKTDSARENKKEILDIFTNYNKLCSESEFNDIRYTLQDACQNGDVELIKIYLSETIENNSKSLQRFNMKQLHIQLLASANINALTFVEDSEVKTIFGNMLPVFFQKSNFTIEWSIWMMHYHKINLFSSKFD